MITHFMNNMWLDSLFDNGEMTLGNKHLGLLYTEPDRSGNYNEVTSSEYSRQIIRCIKSVNSATYNTNNINFGTAESSWGLITHCGIFDSVSGRLLMWFRLQRPINVIIGDTVELKPGFLAIEKE